MLISALKANYQNTLHIERNFGCSNKNTEAFTIKNFCTLASKLFIKVICLLFEESYFVCIFNIYMDSLVAQLGKNLPAMWETWVRKIPWRRETVPTPVLWPGEFHGLHSPWGHKELDMTEYTIC